MPPSVFLKLIPSLLGAGKLHYKFKSLAEADKAQRWTKSLDMPLCLKHAYSTSGHRFHTIFTQCEMFFPLKSCYLLKDLSDGRTIWIDTLDFSASNACVKTGVVIGIFSVVEFLPNMYLYFDELILHNQSKSQNTKEDFFEKLKKEEKEWTYLTLQHHWNLYFPRDCRLLFLQLWKDHISLPALHKWKSRPFHIVKFRT